MEDSPLPNGRQTGGRFAKGNPGGPGNPFAAEVGRQRARLLKSIKDEDYDKALAVIREVMAKGKDADRLSAIKMLWERALGPPVTVDLIERLETLEAAVNSRQ